MKPGQAPKRPSKKTEMLELRVSPEEKAAFLDACRELGRSASAVIRKAMHVEIRRVQERTGRLKMLVTIGAMLPVLMLVGTEPQVTERLGPEFQGGYEIREGFVAPAQCPGDHAITTAPSWPTSPEGVAGQVPEDGIRVFLTFDVTDSGRVRNVRARAPEGYEIFATSAAASMAEWCFPPGAARTGEQQAFDFKWTP
tara:strand:+ start:1478 stop:2068 length:591 start_codon:yes stop_codon:yes gene_type:complete